MNSPQDILNRKTTLEFLFAKIELELEGHGSKNSDVQNAAMYLFHRNRGTYESISNSIYDPSHISQFIDQLSLMRCMYEALLSLEYITISLGNERASLARQFICHGAINQQKFLKKLDSLDTPMRESVIKKYNIQHIETIETMAKEWRKNNTSKYVTHWHGKQHLSQIAQYNDEYTLMHDLYNPAIHTSYVYKFDGVNLNTHRLQLASAMVMARTYLCMYNIFEIDPNLPDQLPTYFQSLCRPLDESIKEAYQNRNLNTED